MSLRAMIIENGLPSAAHEHDKLILNTKHKDSTVLPGLNSTTWYTSGRNGGCRAGATGGLRRKTHGQPEVHGGGGMHNGGGVSIRDGPEMAAVWWGKHELPGR